MFLIVDQACWSFIQTIMKKRLWNFDLKAYDLNMVDFVNDRNPTKLIKEITDFKGESSCIDFIPTSHVLYSLNNSTSFKTYLNIHSHLIYSKLQRNLKL